MFDHSCAGNFIIACVGYQNHANELGSMICLLPAISSLPFGGISPTECKVIQPYSSQTSACHLQTATSFGMEKKPLGYLLLGCE
ncbi:hypothetical protein REPUB_Repub07fG0164100 [Reevesia pubescens]